MRLSKNDPYYRYELKYLISSAQISILNARIHGLMQPDSHASANGKYTVRSLYFDDYHNRCYYENENGNDPRVKYRIRTYDHSADRISLERKRKERGKTLKETVLIDFGLANQLVRGEYAAPISEQPQLVQGLCADMMVNRMKPVVIVEYERTPYIYRFGNVRVTFDTCVSSSRETSSFFGNEILKRPVLPAGMQLLEVKFDEYLPDVIYRALQLDNLQQTTFSKYYLSRKYTV